METHYPVIETNHHLIETIFEKQSMFEKKKSVFDG
jgi:hypothetical protein